MHHVVSMFPWWVETEHLLQPIEEFAGRALGDAYCAIALNVRMPADRDDTCAGPADVSTQEQQVYDLLHVLRATAMLSYPHAEASHDIIGLEIHMRRLLKLRARQTGLLFDSGPRRCPQVCA